MYTVHLSLCVCFWIDPNIQTQKGTICQHKWEIWQSDHSIFSSPLCVLYNTDSNFYWSIQQNYREQYFSIHKRKVTWNQRWMVLHNLYFWGLIHQGTQSLVTFYSLSELYSAWYISKRSFWVNEPCGSSWWNKKGSLYLLPTLDTWLQTWRFMGWLMHCKKHNHQIGAEKSK